MKALQIGDIDIKPGTTHRIQLPVARLYTDSPMNMPVFVKRGKRSGPTVFVSAAIHGDELNGIEIIGRIINSNQLDRLRGTVIAVPMVNGFGVINQSRYLPDRRDLNRSFPGSAKGSLASRVAHQFMTEVVSKCDYGIDLHTGALHRSNLPQIRANLDDPKTLELAKAFGVPVLLNSDLRDGSLRESADQLNVPVMVYEAGQALRLDELSIRAGVRGVINVLRKLDMLRARPTKKPPVEPFVARHSVWIRATTSGVVVHKRELGDSVAVGDLLALVKDPFGGVIERVVNTRKGIIIGRQNIPLVQEGEAMFHIAYFAELEDVADTIEQMQDQLLPNGVPHER